MGSPLSSGLSNLLMKFFKDNALKEASPHLPKCWGRYVDDTQHHHLIHGLRWLTAIEILEGNTLKYAIVLMEICDNSLKVIFNWVIHW